MELKKRVLNLKFDGSEYKVSFPSVKQIKELTVKKENESDLDMTYRFLTALGLEASVIDEMEPDHIKEVIDHLTGLKKNQ